MSNVTSLNRFIMLGFKDEFPFQPLVSEEMSAELRQRIFIPHPDFDRYIMRLKRSAVLLAQSGGGKTAGRFHLESDLEQRQSRFYSHGFEIIVTPPPYAPLIVSYTDFERFLDKFPPGAEQLDIKELTVPLREHVPLLMLAIAEALLSFVLLYPAHFQSSSEETRKRVREFLVTYLKEDEWLEKVAAKENLQEVSTRQALKPAERRKLRLLIVNSFNMDGLRTFCVDLGINYDDLGGEGITGKAREVVALMERDGRILELEMALTQQQLNDSRSSYWSGNSTKQLLRKLKDTLTGLKLDKLVIVVDNVDGYGETKEHPVCQAALVLDLLDTLSLFEPDFVTWKFFLPEGTAEWVRQSNGRRKRRLDLVLIKWTETELAALLSARMEAASAGSGVAFDSVVRPELSEHINVESALIQMALRHRDLGPPRALLELAELLFEDRACATQEAARLSLADWERFVVQVADQLIPEGETSSSGIPELNGPERVEAQAEEQDFAAVVVYWQNHKAELRQKISRTFDMPELDELCSDLHITEGEIGGETPSEKARKLIGYLERRGNLEALIRILPQKRPNEDW